MKNLFTELSSKELKEKCGVYRITCKQHSYIGSSKSLYSRLREHCIDLRNGNHTNSYLQRCYNKHTSDELFYQIIEFCKPEERITKEAYYIKFLEATMNNQDPVTKELSEKSKNKISKSLKESYKKGLHKRGPDKKPVEMYNLYGKFIKEFKTCDEAAIELGVSTHHIQVTASKYYEGKICGLNRFRYKDSKVPIKTFNFVRPQIITSYFDFYIITQEGIEIPIKRGIKNINQILVDELLKGNTTMMIKAKPTKSD
jgi:hypothetical protein